MSITLPYSSSRECQAQLAGIEAIDFFFARQFCQQLEQPSQLAFHLVLALHWAQRQGHSCLPLTEIANQRLWQGNESGEVSGLATGYEFPELSELHSCASQWQASEAEGAALLFDGERLYMRRLWQFECEVAEYLRERMQLSPLNASQQASLAELMPRLFASSTPGEVDWQQVAVANSLGRRFALISGGPGTGKTYSVSRLLAAYVAIQPKPPTILMAAPTGKAAQRLKESIVQAKQDLAKAGIAPSLLDAIPEQAATLHRLLGIRPNSLQLKHDQQRPLQADLLLVDEASMMDLAMFTRLLRALSEHCCLVLLGDVDQLPSVEIGAILAQLARKPHPGYSAEAAEQIHSLSAQQVVQADSGEFDHLTLLTKSRRFGGEIGKLAAEVIAADAKASWQRLSQASLGPQTFTYQAEQELALLESNNLERQLAALTRQYYAPLQSANSLEQAFATLARFRILVATRVGERGVECLNSQIEQLLRVPSAQHYQGRPIMVTENDYSQQLFNGDVGLIWPDTKGKLRAWFEQEQGQYRSVHLARLPAVESVYAMTIHKTQGSEFQEVAMILPEHASELLSPELIYTGLTRAKKHLYIMAGKDLWMQALAQRQARWSGLAEKLSQAL